MIPAGGSEGPGHLPVGDDREERIGIFPGWRWLYVTVIVYAAALILLLYFLTSALNFGTR
jgi:hypothetical protein